MFAKQVEITGVVQGVGFRPFLFGLATAHHLNGFVSNTARGVDLFIQGQKTDLDAFLQDIPDKKPLLSKISSIDIKDETVKDLAGFEIVKSRGAQTRSTLISPDVSICPDCLKEMLDPKDRRFEYPFINCTNCGPRYTIIRDIPYDRPKTSMAVFPMCSACQGEYDDPLDRRFHAQPNACPICGPQVFLTDNKGTRIDSNDPLKAIELAASLLEKGKIIAVKGLGGFHLAADAKNNEAVELLRKRKQRPHKPFALMAASDSPLFDHVKIDDHEKDLLHSFHRPIVLLNKKDSKGQSLLTELAPSLAPNNLCLGIMLPYTPLHYLLLAKGPDILVMTSGNRPGEPLSIDNADALDAFSHIADYFLFHDRDIYFRADDSIARVQKQKTRFLRRSRGYAPLPLDIKLFNNDELPKVLGCGAGMKSTVCLTKGQYAFLSQHIGELENPKVHDFYTQTVSHMETILDINPEIVVHDLHPGYFSTQYANELSRKGIPLVAIQHHHAHALSCMVENGLDGEVIALTLDGTGLGSDGHIWGGEILTCTYESFKRHAHLVYLPMPGGDAAVLEPWRMAASLLYNAFGQDFLNLDIAYIRDMDEKKLKFLIQMMERQVNCPMTSSTGRVFDGVSSLLGICHNISHESQAAMELEALAGFNPSVESAYPFEIGNQDNGPYVMNLDACIRALVADIQSNIPADRISTRFHTTIAQIFMDTAVKVHKNTGLDRVVLSGGVFNNDMIFSLISEGLEKRGFKVYTHSLVPCGDGGIALGQAMAGAAQMASREIDKHV